MICIGSYMKSDEHFFMAKSTYELIAELGCPLDWTIYVGLGATLDRTSVSWAGLVTRLFARFDIGITDAELWVERIGPTRAATTLESMYRAKFPDTHTEEMQNDIHRELYGPRRDMNGRLLENLAKFAFVNAREGKSVAFVTPNYDAYLYEELEDAYQATTDMQDGSGPQLQRIAALTDKRSKLAKRWNDSNSISCTHLHGLVGIKTKLRKGTPVLGEIMYADTAARTLGALTEAFEGRNVLLVGTSVADGPLVNALLKTRSGTGLKRYAIQPLQGPEWLAEDDAQREQLADLNDRRLEALNVKAIRPHLFGQVGQLFAELTEVIRVGDPDALKRRNCERRYDRRLEAWATSWISACRDNEGVQKRHHNWLGESLDSVRKLLGAPAEEALKLEVWVRWKPNDANRKLAKWASSVGSWTAFDAMRMDDIDASSRYRSVVVFCAGAPKILHEPQTSDALSNRDRWLSYFGIPIWTDADSHYGQIPVGIVTLASMWSGRGPHDRHPAGSIAERNLEKLAKVIGPMRLVGKAILIDSATQGVDAAEQELDESFATLKAGL